MVRMMEGSAGEQDDRHEARLPSRRQTMPQRPSLAVRDAARQLGVSPDTVGRGMREGRINATERGKYWQLSPAAVNAEERKRLCHALRNELIRLRVRWRSGGRAALEVKGAAHRHWDAARKWIEEQRKKQKTPGDVCTLIAATPAIQKLLRQDPTLLVKAQALLAQLGPDATWE